MLTSKNKVIIYAQNAFTGITAKTGIGFLRYGLCETVAIVDKDYDGKTAKDFYPDLKPIPIFDSINSAKSRFKNADVLLIGIAPPGGRLPSEWFSDIKLALKSGMNIVNGLHDFLSEILEIKNLAEKNNLFIWDVRKTNNNYPIANGRPLDYSNEIILTVGTDAALGKMTTTIELIKSATKSNIPSKFVATGQTGMIISGRGIPIDAITGDFMAGAIEEEVIKEIKESNRNEMIFVEGQGSILHPGWSGVTLALLHGALPHKLILCHQAGIKYLRNTNIKIDSLDQFIKIYEGFSLPIRKAKVVGVSLNTLNIDKSTVQEEIKKLEDEVQLPVDDPFLNGGDKLLNACLK